MKLHQFALLFACCQIFLLPGCHLTTSPEEREEAYAYEIITQTIREIAGLEIVPPPPPPPPDSSIAGSVEASARLSDSIIRGFNLYKDTATFMVAIFDTFTKPVVYLLNKFYPGDYHGLKSQLLPGTKQTKPLDQKRIGNLSPWKIVEPRPCKSKQCGDREYLGEIAFSRIAFNERFNLALFTYDYACCTRQGIILAKRKNRKWHIIRHDLPDGH